MDAGFRKYLDGRKIQVINYSPYIPMVKYENGEFKNCTNNWGAWSCEHLIELLLGEIDRLTDDKNGYGPKGKNYISSVQIPKNILNAYDLIKKNINIKSRQADNRYK